MAAPPTHLLDSQVGGHAGVLTTEDGSLLIKPASNHELIFYRSLQEDESLQPLRYFTPKFLGTLKLEGRVDTSQPCETGGIVVEPIPGAPQKESIVLENLSFPFLKPNILDIKLGTVLYAEGAPADKIARMEKTARNTTSFESGIRLTGFQVYDNITNLPVNTPKAYGKSIKVAQLGEGIAKFFPVGSAARELAESAAPAPSSGLPRETLLVILRAIRDDIAEIKEAFEALELRMVGGSLLIIYEADWARAADGLDRIGVDDEEDDDDEEEEEEEDGDEIDEDDDDADSKKPGPPYIVKLIDFAHTRLVPGQGPDKGVLLGFDTVLRLLDARLEQILSTTT